VFVHQCNVERGSHTGSMWGVKMLMSITRTHSEQVSGESSPRDLPRALPRLGAQADQFIVRRS
jgi:hypothetical protein